jgi:hypothetical protein
MGSQTDRCRRDLGGDFGNPTWEHDEVGNQVGWVAAVSRPRGTGPDVTVPGGLVFYVPTRVLADGGHPLRGGLPGERQPLQPPQPPRR